MKKYSMRNQIHPALRSSTPLLAVLAAVLALCTAASAQPPAAPADPLAAGFRSIPDSARPLAYWWWLNGNTDQAAITRDLEAMRAEGYAGAVLMDANGTDQWGAVPVAAGPTFGSPAWQVLFQHTLKEAKRLNLQISLTMQSGWNVGGPTVTGAQSAKLLTFARATVHGPGTATVSLPQPPSKNGFYQDIAVLAYPLRHGQPLAGDDDRKPIRDLKEKSAAKETGGSVPDSKPLLTDYPAVPGEEDFEPGQAVNLTSHMSADGKLTWSVPAGDWELLRIGYTSSDSKVSTSSGSWQGLVIDYLDPNALTQYWNTNVQPILDNVKPWLGTSLRYVYTDSWEVGGLNWTPRFRQAFLADHGYDPVPYLPIVAGRIIGSRDASNRFLNDLRRTVANLILTGHYQVMAQLAQKNHLGSHPESGGPHGGPFDALQLLGSGSFPMTEFWAPSKMHRSTDLDRFFVKEASSAAHIYNKTLVAGEGFTSIGPQWEESPGQDLKPTFDQAVCAGLNKLVWHTFTSSPKSAGLPGQEYFAGTHFNPNVTWFRDGKAFFTYMGRIQFLMQQGVPVSDVLYYYGDHVPNLVQFKGSDPAHVLPGYDYDVLNEEVLTHGLSVLNHRIRTANGTEYSELVLPPLTNISLPALKAIDKLVTAGATVVGAQPTHLTGLPTPTQSDADVLRIAGRLWANCGVNGVTTVKAGAGKIVCASTARQTLVDADLQPDLLSAGPAPDTQFDFAHRRSAGAEIYFIRNKLATPVSTVLSLRVHGLTPQFFNPETGAITDARVYLETKDGRTNLPVWFDGYGSVALVFRKPAGPHIVRLERNGEDIFPALKAGTAPFTIDSSLALTTQQPGSYQATDAAGHARSATVAAPQVTPIQSPWTLAFPPNWGAPPSVTLNQLDSWTDSPDEGVRHYSGTAAYTTSFTLPALPPQARVTLDLGQVRETARVTLNGHEIAVLWKQPFQLDITAAAHAGENQLQVQVTNLWPNRIIGDQSLPPQKRYTHANTTKFKADTPLIPSGLLGPVQLTVITPAQLSSDTSK